MNIGVLSCIILEYSGGCSRPLILRFTIIRLIPCVLFTTRFEELADG